jgi:hypothetical protein
VKLIKSFLPDFATKDSGVNYFSLCPFYLNSGSRNYSYSTSYSNQRTPNKSINLVPYSKNQINNSPYSSLPINSSPYSSSPNYNSPFSPPFSNVSVPKKSSKSIFDLFSSISQQLKEVERDRDKWRQFFFFVFGIKFIFKDNFLT